MSLALSTQTAHHRLRTKQLYIAAQASGNYIPGGDLVNLQSGIVNTIPGARDSTIGYPGVITDYSVISAPPGFSASLVKGASLSTWGLQVFETGAPPPRCRVSPPLADNDGYSGAASIPSVARASRHSRWNGAGYHG